LQIDQFTSITRFSINEGPLSMSKRYDRKDEQEREERQASVALSRRAALFGGLAIVAFLISIVNFAAVINSLWQPMGAFNMPVYLLFAVTALFAGISFLKTRRRALYCRDHPDESEQ